MTPSNLEPDQPNPDKSASNGLEDQLRSGAGTEPLPPPPWYRRSPIGLRGIVRIVTVVVCLWASWVWYMSRECQVIGWVADLYGRPLSGVAVHTEDGSAATISEKDGRFTLNCRGKGLAWIMIENQTAGTSRPVELARGEQINLGRLYLYVPRD